MKLLIHGYVVFRNFLQLEDIKVAKNQCILNVLEDYWIFLKFYTVITILV